MKQYVLLISLAFSGLTLADAYLCIPEAGAGVKHGAQLDIRADLYDFSDRRFIQSNENGEWQVKELGDDQPIFDKCSSEHFCEHSQGYGGAFFRTNTGIFSVTWIIGQEDQSSIMAVAKGRCSKL